MAQDFSIPPPPLRLPLHVKQVKAVIEQKIASPKAEYNSNILARLEEAVKENLEKDIQVLAILFSNLRLE